MATARRRVITGLLAGSAAAAAGAVHRAEAEPVPQAEEREIVAALGRIEAQLRRLAEPLERCEPFVCRVTDRIRENQKQFFKVNSKFPDFLDVGADVWESTYDWHLRTGQTPSVGRLPDGRVGMTFMLTTLVVRPDVANDFIGLGYDTR